MSPSDHADHAPGVLGTEFYVDRDLEQWPQPIGSPRDAGADGGPTRRLTTQISDEIVPTWSHDGRWIYFSGDQGTGRDI